MLEVTILLHPASSSQASPDAWENKEQHKSGKAARNKEVMLRSSRHSQVRLCHFVIPLSKFLRCFHITRNRKC